MRIHYFQHVPFEGLSMISEWASLNSYSVGATKFYEDNYKLPAIDDFDLLIVMGGPMGVNDDDTCPWLIAEKSLIKQSIGYGKYVLGICLGAQLIASVLGATVASMQEKEIGWFPIAFSDAVAGHSLLSGLNSAMVVLHWHGERFEIPDNAIHLASSAVCDNQGFIYGDKVLALQFHLEMDKAAVKRIVKACPEDMMDSLNPQFSDDIIGGSTKYSSKRSLFQLLSNWVSSMT